MFVSTGIEDSRESRTDIRSFAFAAKTDAGDSQYDRMCNEAVL